MQTRLHVYIDPDNAEEVKQAAIMRRDHDAVIWTKPSPGTTFDIDSPLIQAGVEALFGQHPERGGPEREQAVFAVLMATRAVLLDAIEEADTTGQWEEALSMIRLSLVEPQQREIDALRSGHHAVRGDSFEAYLKRWRDKFEKTHGYHFILDRLLDDYRLHADTGTSLAEEVIEG